MIEHTFRLGGRIAAEQILALFVALGCTGSARHLIGPVYLLTVQVPDGRKV